MQEKVICILGTRPEVIKMAPVIQALRASGVAAPILVTAQHRDLLDQMLAVFGLTPDWDLDLMKPDQTLAALTGVMVPALHDHLMRSGATAVLAQGDTATVFCAALAAYYAGVPFGHVEAGLRSGDLQSPFPEEGMRRLAAVLARWHFAPTEKARAALLAEGVPDGAIHVVGNTVIDALLDMAGRPDLPRPKVPALLPGERRVLVTLHRRENFGAPLERVLGALAAIAKRFPDAQFVFPVHPNPHVRTPVLSKLQAIDNIHLVPPMDYPELVATLKESHLVITDSGGLQEEGPALGKPVLVCREVTERPEAVEAGSAILVGTDPARLIETFARIWEDPAIHGRMAVPRFPYGDGASGQRIAAILTTGLAVMGRVPASPGSGQVV